MDQDMSMISLQTPRQNISMQRMDLMSQSSTSFRKFIESTTFHGIRNVFSDGPKLRRIVWSFCVIAAATYFFMAISVLIMSYLSYDVVTRVTLVNQEHANFPAVTICNFNPLRKEYVKKKNLTNFVSIVGNVFKNRDNVNWNQVQDIVNTSIEDIIRDGAHKMKQEDMFRGCTFQGQICQPHQFKPVFTRMGLCYTFNKDSKNMSRAAVVSNPGDDFGLKLTLQTQQEKYYGVQSMVAGFKVHIHDQDELPLVKEYGFAVMPGTSTYVAVSKTVVKTMPAPYKTNCENKKLPGYSIYSKPLCYESCRASFIMKKCGCRTPEMPEEYIKQSVKNCSCPRPCELTAYETRLSYAQYPSEHAKEDLTPIILNMIREDHSLQRLQEMQGVDRMRFLYYFLGIDFVKIEIFLEDLNYNLIEDLPKYQFESLFAEAGGMLGLLLGASVLTILELFDFLFSLVVNRLTKKNLDSK